MGVSGRFGRFGRGGGGKFTGNDGAVELDDGPVVAAYAVPGYV